jgi:histidinol-phosphate/aromatic aminotransferase/cobyric acid decarboxylase-like protein
MILNNFSGLVVIDEAYINFSKQKSFIQELPDTAIKKAVQQMPPSSTPQ